MYGIKYIVLALSTLIIFNSCVSRGARNEINNLTVTIAPVKYIVDKITGNHLNINVLVPAGASPETYEPTPQQIIALSSSKLIFSTGLIDFEQKLSERLSSNADNTIVDLSEGIEVMEGNCSHASHIGGDARNVAKAKNMGHAGHGVDPHIWTSPLLLKKMAATAYKYLNATYPDSTNYHENYISLLQQLDSLNNEISQKIKSCSKEYFIIYHPALTYYANDYEIRQIALEQDGKEPSVAYLKQVITLAKAGNVKHIFYQSQFSRSTVESVANEIGAQPVEIDPLKEDVINNLRQITDLIIKQ